MNFFRRGIGEFSRHTFKSLDIFIFSVIITWLTRSNMNDAHGQCLCEMLHDCEASYQRV